MDYSLMLMSIVIDLRLVSWIKIQVSSYQQTNQGVVVVA